MEKNLTVGGMEVTLKARKGDYPVVFADVTGVDGKDRRASYDGFGGFDTNVMRKREFYGASHSVARLNPKLFGEELAPALEDALRAFFFEACALEFKARLERIQADYDAKGYGVVPRPELLAEVNAYLEAKADQEKAANVPSPRDEIRARLVGCNRVTVEGINTTEEYRREYDGWADDMVDFLARCKGLLMVITFHEDPAPQPTEQHRRLIATLPGFGYVQQLLDKEAQKPAYSRRQLVYERIEGGHGHYDVYEVVGHGSQPSDDEEAYSPWRYLADAQREIDDEEERRERGRW